MTVNIILFNMVYIISQKKHIELLNTTYEIQFNHFTKVREFLYNTKQLSVATHSAIAANYLS